MTFLNLPAGANPWRERCLPFQAPTSGGASCQPRVHRGREEEKGRGEEDGCLAEEAQGRSCRSEPGAGGARRAASLDPTRHRLGRRWPGGRRRRVLREEGSSSRLTTFEPEGGRTGVGLGDSHAKAIRSPRWRPFWRHPRGVRNGWVDSRARVGGRPSSPKGVPRLEGCSTLGHLEETQAGRNQQVSPIDFARIPFP